jgi:hypothetical protein
MGISQKDVKLLWGRAASRCSVCRIELTHDKQSTNISFPVGEQAHIVAEERDGPRGNSILTPEERNSYHNLILLCPTHHTIIDKNEEDFPVEKLHIIKSRHELWVQQTLAKETSNQKKELLPISDLLYLIEDIRPLLLWLYRPVPTREAQSFFSALNNIWQSHGIVTEEIDSNLAYGVDSFLRPLASGLFRSNDHGYTQHNVYFASERFAQYFQDRGFKWDVVPSHLDTEILLFYFKRNLDEINKNSKLLDKNEANIVRLALYILSYYKSAMKLGKYIDISEGFVRQSLSIIETFLADKLGFLLPDVLDEYGLVSLREILNAVE